MRHGIARYQTCRAIGDLRRSSAIPAFVDNRARAAASANGPLIQFKPNQRRITMKKFAILGAVLLGSSSAAFAAAPEAVTSFAMSCCDIVLACCDAAMSCCP